MATFDRKAYMAEYNRRYYAANSERAKERARADYVQNRETRLATARFWKAKNADCVIAYNASYYAHNRDVLLERAKSRQKEHPESWRRASHKRRVRLAQVLGFHSDAEWSEIASRQEWRCAICRRRRKLERDHIVPLSRGGSDYAFNIQGLCKPCNSGKRDKAVSKPTLFDCRRVS